MSQDDPTRLVDEPSATERVRAALGAARHDLPSEAELASLAARLGPLLGPPGGGGAPDPTGLGATAGGLTAKAIGVVVALATVSGALWWSRDAWTVDAPPRPPPRQVAEPVAPAPPPEAPIPTGLDVPDDLLIEPPDERLTERAPRRRAEVDPEGELALIREAQDALRSSAARALALTAEHRRRFGDGTLAQEREVIAIDALVRLDRHAAAQERADAFHRRWPRSAHGRRVDVLVRGDAR